MKTILFHFRTIFVKPENAINIPEKYKINPENLKEEGKSGSSKQRRKPIRIRHQSGPWKNIKSKAKKDNSKTKVQSTSTNTKVNNEEIIDLTDVSLYFT